MISTGSGQPDTLRAALPSTARPMRPHSTRRRRGLPHQMTVTHADYRLSQLDQLEAESIHIFRAVSYTHLTLPTIYSV